MTRSLVTNTAAVLMALTTLVGLAACGSPGSGGRAATTSARTQCAVPDVKEPCATLWVTAAGEIELNGQRAELDQVGEALKKLAGEKGVVLYGRDGAGADPHPNAMKVIQLVIENQVPVRMSTRRDFRYAGTDGPGR
jgi:hypothetical protein